MKVGLVTAPVTPSARAAPRTNAVLPAPSSPRTNTTAAERQVAARARRERRRLGLRRGRAGLASPPAVGTDVGGRQRAAWRTAASRWAQAGDACEVGLELAAPGGVVEGRAGMVQREHDAEVAGECGAPRLSAFAAWRAPGQQRVANVPSVQTTRGRTSASWRSSFPRQAAISSSSGSRLPGGRHLSTCVSAGGALEAVAGKELVEQRAGLADERHARRSSSRLGESADQHQAARALPSPATTVVRDLGSRQSVQPDQAPGRSSAGAATLRAAAAAATAAAAAAAARAAASSPPQVRGRERREQLLDVMGRAARGRRRGCEMPETSSSKRWSHDAHAYS